MLYQQLKNHIVESIESNKDVFVRYSDDVADHPELSGKEYETSKKITGLLGRLGYTCTYPFAGIDTAFRAIYGEDNHRYKIALLTEYDALPEIGHGCGHCLSGAISMLAAVSLKDLQDQLNADIHIIGTPDEEVEGQKCHMADKGVFDGYDMAMMVHLYNRNIAAPKLQCCLIRDYHFYGKAAHASAAPWEGRNALNGAQLFLHAVDMLRQHTRTDAQFHGILSQGGDFPNIVPEHAAVKIMIRALDREYVEVLDRYVDDCAKGAAIATQTTWEKCRCGEDYYNLKENQQGIDAIREVFSELDIEENGDQEEIFGSSDIGNVSFHCPSFQPCLQLTDFDTPLHTREFAAAMKTDKAHQILMQGAKVIAFTTAKLFSDHGRIKGLRGER